MDFLFGILVGSLATVVFLPVLKILFKRLVKKAEEV